MKEYICPEEMQSQAVLCGEGLFHCLRGCVRFSPLKCGVIAQAHIRGLPDSGFFGLQIENSGCCFSLPPLLSCEGEALMSVYAGCLPPHLLCGGEVIITSDPCAGCPCRRIACGRIRPCRQCRIDPRPLFASSIRW